MKEEPIAVNVRVLDKEYRIACKPEEQDGLLSSARLLDRRMREIHQSGRVVGSDRIAVLAALNVTYELLQQRDQLQRASGSALQRIQGLDQRVERMISANKHLDAEPK